MNQSYKDYSFESGNKAEQEEFNWGNYSRFIITKI